jgi:Flp pilus assembly protein TadD
MAGTNQSTAALSASPLLVRLAAQAQIDFELEFFAGVLAHHPDCVEVLKMHAKNLATVKRHNEGLVVDHRITRLRPFDALAHYNFACSLALTGHHDDALTILRKAVELGYRDFRYMRQDGDLASVRQDPRFRIMLKEFEQR